MQHTIHTQPSDPRLFIEPGEGDKDVYGENEIGLVCNTEEVIYVRQVAGTLQFICPQESYVLCDGRLITRRAWERKTGLSL